MKRYIYMVVLCLVFVAALLLASTSLLFGYLAHVKAMWEWESGLHEHAVAQWVFAVLMVVSIFYLGYCAVRDTFKTLALGIFR